VWLLSVTITAGIQKIAHPDPRIGFLAQARDLASKLASGAIPPERADEIRVLIFNAQLDAAVTAVFLAVVGIVVFEALRAGAARLRRGGLAPRTAELRP
jgi:carbon starvation protein